ncbi:MAG: metalloregulator ArsR/SmtB family transcription factor [Myxococcales bacterium]|jgi:DNA-binding transcriptional ArsR family regulator|nr:metalloregulator ArsR/SmtB family transcription factor [Myxococcales bacterium]
MPKPTLTPQNLESVATRFRILGVPLRLQILNELAGGERTVSALVEATGSTQPNVSKHLTTLLAHRLVKREKRGNSAYYSVADPAVFELCEIVCGNIERSLEEERRAFGG